MTPDHDDALRARLAALDPMPPSLPVDPPTSPRAQELLERVMLTTELSPEPATTTPRWRRPATLAAAAAAVAAIGVGAVLLDAGESTPTKAKTTLALKAPAGGGVTMGSCIVFSVDVLKDMPVAFGGTVTQVGDASVSIAVDHWYKGGDADVVTVATPPGNTSVGTVEFVTGKRYLVTATNGTVNSCGYTAEATPDLERSFDEAFTP